MIRALCQPANAIQPLSPRLALAWSVGRFATAAMLVAFGNFVLFYWVSIAKLDPGVAGSLIFAARIADLLVAPAVGVWSDGMQTRWGRRRPILLAGAIVGGLGSVLLLHAPEAGEGVTTIYAAVVLMLFTLGYTTFNIPHLAMPNEMSSDPADRVRLMSYGTVFLTLGYLGAGAGLPFLIEYFGQDRAGYAWASLFFGGTICAAMLICVVGTARASFVTERQSNQSVWAQFRELGRNRPFVVLMLSKITAFLLAGGQSTGMLFFMQSVLKLPVRTFGIAFVCQSLSGLIAVPFWTWAARRFGNRNTCLVMFAIGFAVDIWWGFARPHESEWLFCARYLTMGLVIGGWAMLSMAMLTDTIEIGSHKSGQRREGLYAAVSSFADKSTASLAALLTGVLIGLAGFDKSLPPSADQDARVVAVLYAIVGWLPALGFAASMVCLLFYRLDEGRRGGLAGTAIASAPR